MSAIALSASAYVTPPLPLVSRSNFCNGGPADTAASFSVNALNQAVSHTGTVLKYDANGNLTEDGGALYTWDARDRLVAITSKATGAKTTIQYDGLDRWAVITDSGREVRYRWCGQELCAALDTAGKAKAHYFGDRGMYVLLPSGQPQRVAFVTDHLGSVKQYHDTAGNWLLSLDHEAYGSISRADLSPAGVSLLNSGVVIPGWAGLYMHWPTGTYLATYRPYSSQIKRWLKRDPIHEFGGINLYGYAKASPSSLIDARGLRPCGPNCNVYGPGDPDPRGGKCVTAECAAGLLPAPSDNRTQDEIDQDLCEMICGWFGPGNLVPGGFTVRKISEWGGQQAGTTFGCKIICRKKRESESACHRLGAL